MRLCMCVLGQLKSAKWGKGLSVSWVAPPVFYFLLAGLEQHRKWEGVASFFGIVALGSRKANSRLGLVCLLGEVLDSKRALAKLHRYCLTFATTCLGMLLLLFCGVMISKRSSNVYFLDGGKKKSLCVF